MLQKLDIEVRRDDRIYKCKKISGHQKPLVNTNWNTSRGHNSKLLIPFTKEIRQLSSYLILVY